MNPESSYVAHRWYAYQDGQMVPCDPPTALMTPAEREEREQRAQAMSQRQVQTRRQALKVVSR